MKPDAAAWAPSRRAEAWPAHGAALLPAHCPTRPAAPPAPHALHGNCTTLATSAVGQSEAP
eukprot:2886940-Pyramimonas_sp.AAC.1